METFDVIESRGPVDAGRLETLQMQIDSLRHRALARRNDQARLDAGQTRPTRTTRVARWHIPFRPYTQLGLATVARHVPAVAALDTRILRGLAGHGRDAGAIDFSDPASVDPLSWGGAGGSSSDGSMPVGGGFSDPFGSGIDPTSVVGVDPSVLGGILGGGDPQQQIDPSGILGQLGGVLGQLGQTEPGLDPGFSQDPNNAPPVSDPSQGGSTPAGPGPGTVAVGALLQTQMDLATWNVATGNVVCDPTDYGKSPSEFTGTNSARTTSALASYQNWANAVRGEALRTDGVLDPATRASLDRTLADIAAGKSLPQSPADKPGAGMSSTTMLAIGAAVVVGGYFLLKRKKAA